MPDPTAMQRALEYHQKGDLVAAEQRYREILRSVPDDPAALLYLGVVYYDRRNLDEAIRLMSRAIALQPQEPSAHNHIGLALLARHEYPSAVQHFKTAIQLKPQYFDALNNLGNALKRQKNFVEAEQTFREILRLRPDYLYAHHNLGLLLFEQRRFAEAEKEFLRTLEIDPQFHKAHYQLGQAAENMGNFDEAAARYETALKVEPEHFQAMSALLALRGYTVSDTFITAAEQAAQREDLLEPASFTLCYGLAKRFERLKNYDKAFAFLKLANQRRSKGRGYHPERVAQLFERYRKTFTPAFLQKHRDEGLNSSRPLFIVGMPRTGTTLTEQILAAHPLVHGAGELPDLPKAVSRLPAVMSQTLDWQVPGYPLCLEYLNKDYLQAMGDFYLQALARANATAERVVDKNPFNFLNVGLIRVLFPQARIVHCQRHPLDVGISCFTELFELQQDFTTDFTSFAHYYAHYHALMRHWREVLGITFFDLSYESLILEPEKTTRSLLEFCGLPWNEACLQFQQTDRAVLTPSKWQVRQPLYHSSIGRWRHYEAHIEPLRVALQAQGVKVDFDVYNLL
jgi:Flp pilus assembly protein TadD